MEQPGARLLRTYSGLRRGPGGARPGAASAAAARRAGLRRLPPPAPWISPPVDRKRLFSSSCSSSTSFEEAASSPSFGDPRRRILKARGQEKAPAAPPSSEDSDFLPPTRKARLRKKPPRRKGTAKKKGEGAKENKAPLGELGGQPAATSTFVPPTPLRRNITQRRRKHVQRGMNIQIPLLSSTPGLLQLAKRDLEEQGGEESILRSSPVSYACFHPNHLQEVVQEDCCRGGGDGLSELSSVKMDGDAREMGGSLELFTLEDVPSLQRKSVHEDSQAEPLPVTLFQPHCSSSPNTLFKRSSALQSCNSCSKTGASLQNREGLTISPGCYVVSPSCLQSPDADHDQSLPVSPKEPLCGVLQLQASLHDDKIYLWFPKDAAPLANKRQRVSVQACTSYPKAVGELNGAVSEEGNDSIKDYSSPQLQPIVLLDSRVVPNWLASQSTKKQAIVKLSSKKHNTLQSDSLCGLSDTSKKLVPTCSTVGTGRKACISGFSTSRWGQGGKLEKARQKRNLGWKRQANPSLLQERLKFSKMEDYLSSSILSPECSFKNSRLWRRIRASFSLHKKKIILSEAESSSGSIANASYPSVMETPKTPFTQKLGYSISPSSSMVLLSSMTSSATSERVLTDEEKVYRECKQDGPISFEEFITPDKMQKCEKIGEGVFGEVFRTEGERGLTALKIIPIEGSDRVNGEPQKTFGEILPEIIISKELSLLADEEVHQTSGFIGLLSIHCVQGSYPDRLLAAWDEYHRLRESENDRPDFFGERQLFVVLEFEYGGMNLEYMRNQQLSSVLASKSILHQVTASLAVAEESLHFEHRDLHWGNVLVKKTTLKEVSFTLNGETHTLPTHGILVNIIDYTFSRLERDGLTVYCDLSTDEEIFQGRGDYQFDIYRQMREENANSWADYFPHSNVLWLHYLADKLLKEVSYKRKPTTSSLKKAQKQLKLFSEEVLSFKSATDLLSTSNFFQ
ncbi:serine/threonine-protein kinase haspin [Lacerta agilis]|uniref:serine/threonine-protein kinase haspin n=1 Tax=Lacerta agilis TaxID=80427 RepID=UPI00141A08DD|nr:serine/threonine-protein kinase haspin [Lacerta agilis]